MTLVSLPCLPFLAWSSLGCHFCISYICFSQVISVFQSEFITLIISGCEGSVSHLYLSGRPKNLRGRSLQPPGRGRVGRAGSYLEAGRPSWASLKSPDLAHLVSLSQGQPDLACASHCCYCYPIWKRKSGKQPQFPASVGLG